MDENSLGKDDSLSRRKATKALRSDGVSSWREQTLDNGTYYRATPKLTAPSLQDTTHPLQDITKEALKMGNLLGDTSSTPDTASTDNIDPRLLAWNDPETGAALSYLIHPGRDVNPHPLEEASKSNIEAMEHEALEDVTDETPSYTIVYEATSFIATFAAINIYHSMEISRPSAERAAPLSGNSQDAPTLFQYRCSACSYSHHRLDYVTKHEGSKACRTQDSDNRRCLAYLAHKRGASTHSRLRKNYNHIHRQPIPDLGSALNVLIFWAFQMNTNFSNT